MAFPGKTMHNPATGMVLEFVYTASSTHGEMVEVTATYAPGSPEPPPHYHPHQEEHFTLLEGEMTVRMDGMLRILQKGDELVVPAAKVHSMWNHGTIPARVQWQTRPALRTEHFMETMAGLSTAGKVGKNGKPPLLQGIISIRHFSDEFRLATPPYPIQRVLFILLVPLAKLMSYKATYPEFLD
jgi:quercetin dioxygenase-like cupin family protein